MSEIKKSNSGGRVKRYTQDSLGKISLPNDNTITRDMIQDSIVNNDKLAADLKKVATTESGDYTVVTGDGVNIIFFDDTSSNRTCTLPAVASNIGRVLLIKNISTDKGLIMLDPTGVEEIDGHTFIDLDFKNCYVKLFCDGTQWNIIAENITSMNKQYTLPLTGGNLASTTYSTGVPYRTLNGAWRLKFNFKAAATTPSTGHTIYITGISAASGTEQAIAARHNSADVSAGYVNSLASGVYLTSSVATSALRASGDIALTAKPAFVE